MLFVLILLPVLLWYSITTSPTSTPHTTTRALIHAHTLQQNTPRAHTGTHARAHTHTYTHTHTHTHTHARGQETTIAYRDTGGTVHLTPSLSLSLSLSHTHTTKSA